MSSKKMPTSTGLAEALGGTLGMLLAIACVMYSLRLTSPNRAIQVLIVVVGIFAFFVAMIGGSVLGGTLAVRWQSRKKDVPPENQDGPT